MDMWSILLVFMSLALLISILESIHRKSKRRRAEFAERQLRELRNQQQQYVYTIQANASADQQHIFATNNNSTHILRLNDLPPKYEDLIIANNAAFATSTPNVSSDPATAAGTAHEQPPPLYQLQPPQQPHPGNVLPAVATATTIASR